jgi:hypothetical protein
LKARKDEILKERFLPTNVIDVGTVYAGQPAPETCPDHRLIFGAGGAEIRQLLVVANPPFTVLGGWIEPKEGKGHEQCR